MSRWYWGYSYWGIGWLLIGFLAAELAGYFGIAPWPTLSETVWHSSRYPFVGPILFGVLIALCIHFIYVRPLWHSVALRARNRRPRSLAGQATVSSLSDNEMKETESLCKCGHPKTEHDYFGCIYGSCQDTCKRRYGSSEGKPFPTSTTKSVSVKR